jgi:Protein of unknown function (DUF3489)
MTTIELTTTQTQVLQHALDHNKGLIVWFPENIKGGARQKVLNGLFNRALITSDGGTNWYVAAEGYDALGRTRPTLAEAALLATQLKDQRTQGTGAQHEAVCANEVQAHAHAQAAPNVTATTHATPTDSSTEPAKLRTRENSKQATVIQMLSRVEGATIAQICEATGWQAHTVRGTFAGAFKKRLGLNITSQKSQGADRVYRIV